VIWWKKVALGQVCQQESRVTLSLNQLLNTAGMLRLKTVSTSQGHIHKYEDLKGKIHNCYANIYINQKCLRKDVIPKLCLEENTKNYPSLKIYRAKTTQTGMPS
jgi:hypothetical protein